MKNITTSFSQYLFIFTKNLLDISIFFCIANKKYDKKFQTAYLHRQLV